MAERIKIKARPVKQRIKIQYEGEELNYCPGCGAKMDGGEDDGQAD